MSGSNHHRIHRQTLELDVDNTAAMVAQTTVTQALQTDTYRSALESVLDRIAPADQIMPIERLELDLGIVDMADLPQVLLDNLERAVAEHPNIPSHVHSNAHSRVQATEQRRRAFTASDDAHEQTSSNRQTPLPQVSRTDALPGNGQQRALLLFLVSGRLPWWFEPPGNTWMEDTLEQLPAQSLQPLLIASVNARTRLQQLLDDAALAKLYQTFTGIDGADRVLASFTLYHQAGAAIRTLYWNTLFEHPATGTSAYREKLLRRLVTVLQSTSVASLASAEAIPAKSESLLDTPAQPVSLHDTSAQPEPLLDTKALLASLPPAWRSSELARRVPTPDDVVQRQNSTKPASAHSVEQNQAADTAMVDSLTNELVNGEATSGIHIRGVGGLLLHPFLEELFRSCGWWDGNAWTSTTGQNDAVAALVFLAFGEIELTEAELVLQKQLLGIPWELPITLSPLTEAAQMHCIELLDAVRSHWAVVKSASDDWLREQFFARDGELFSIDDGYRCCVKSRAQDVLLGKLPWGYGVVRLPWMEKMIFVEWG